MIFILFSWLSFERSVNDIKLSSSLIVHWAIVFPESGTSGGVMVSKLDEQTYTSEFESHRVPLSYGLVPRLSKKLSKLLSFSPNFNHVFGKLFKSINNKRYHRYRLVLEPFQLSDKILLFVFLFLSFELFCLLEYQNLLKDKLFLYY